MKFQTITIDTISRDIYHDPEDFLAEKARYRRMAELGFAADQLKNQLLIDTGLRTPRPRTITINMIDAA